MTKMADLMITSLDVIKGYSLVGAEPLFVLDELQDATIAHSEETTDITGKQGRKLNTLKRNKAVTVSGNNGLLSAGLLETQVGGKFEESAAAPVVWSEQIVVKNNTAVTEFKAVGTVGAEIEALYVLDGNSVSVKKLEQAEAAADGMFSYDPETKTVTFVGIEDGTTVAVYYTRNVAGHVLVNDSDVYSTKCRMYIDGTAEDKCGNIYMIQFYIPKADFNGNFEIAMGGDQVVHAFEANALAGSCGGAGALWTYTVIGANAEDAA